MEKELEYLISLAGTAEFDKALDETCQKYKENPNTEKILADLIKKALEASDSRIDFIEREINIKLQMKQITEIVSLSYIAKTYFNKSRHWLYQRINNSIVNGKPQKFKSNELNTLRFSLKDISEKIGSLSI